MSYTEKYQGASAGTSNAPVELPTLLKDSAGLHVSLQEIEKRIIELGNQLLGPEPRDLDGGKAGGPEPIPSVRRNLDKSQNTVHRIMDELQRIDARTR